MSKLNSESRMFLPSRTDLVGLLDGPLGPGYGPVVAVADEHEAVGCVRGVPGEGHALDQRVGVALQDALVVVRARVALLAVAEDVLGRPAPGHEAPLHARREARPAAAPEPGGLHLVYNVLAAHVVYGPGKTPVPVVGNVLVDVVGGDVARVAKGYLLLAADARQGRQVRHSGDTLADVPDGLVHGHPAAVQDAIEEMTGPQTAKRRRRRGASRRD